MADAISQTSKAQTSISEIPTNNANPSKHFMYKASLVAIFLVLLPLFPSQAPESFKQSRSWELLQLLFVGIAVSYGLFSKKNDEPEKESNNAQSYVSKLFQVSSVFDDEFDNPNVIDENKVQNWNYSQYSRVEPVVVVAKESPKEDKIFDSRICEKPLLLPVRSLKNRVLEMNEIGFIENVGKSRNGELRDMMGLRNLDEKIEENVVLRSPIPWRSRSGRMEIKEEMDLNNLESRSFKLKNSEDDVMSKKNFSSPPPAPPPPPPFPRKSMLSKSNPVAMDPQVSSTNTIHIDGLQLGKSVRTCKISSETVERKSTDYVMNFLEKKIPIEDKKKLVENVLVETSDDEDSDGEIEEDNFKGSSENGEIASTGSNDMGPDVDKKADEFIAKFREQIRQQRIESIRNAQRAGKAFR